MNRHLIAGALTVAAIFGLTNLASAQPLRRPIVVPPLSSYQAPYNPNYYIAPGLTVNQYAYNLATIGRAYQQIPPYVFGYNPYPPMINTAPSYVTPNVYTPYVSPYMASPYAGVYSGYYSPYGLYGTYPRLP